MSGRVRDIVSVETEHGLGERAGPFVVLRVVNDAGDIALGQLLPDQAREIATHLFESAARSEYESDLHSELVKLEVPDQAIAVVMHSVRAGEIRRHTNTEGTAP